MARRKKQTDDLTRLELELLHVLWNGGPGTVQQVQRGLPEGSNLAYTTVQTMLNILHRKGRVRRRLLGRAFEYRAAVSHAEVAGEATRDLVRRLFGGSPERLLMSLIQTSQVDSEQIAALTRRLQQEQASQEEGSQEEDQ